MLAFFGLLIFLLFVIIILYPWPVRLRFSYDTGGDGSFDLSFPHFMPFKFRRVLGWSAPAAQEEGSLLPPLPFHLLHTIVYVDAFEWITDMGTGDAGATAVASGLAWGVKGFALNVLQRHFNFRCGPVILVRPCWGDASLSTSLDCIIRVRPGHLTVVHAKHWWATTVKGVGRVGARERSSH